MPSLVYNVLVQPIYITRNLFVHFLTNCSSVEVVVAAVVEVGDVAIGSSWAVKGWLIWHKQFNVSITSWNETI